MKKLAIFFLTIIVIIVGISYMYMNYKANYYIKQKENYQFSSYYNKELKGNEIATLINKAYDNNSSNNVAKDKKGKFIENDSNSIKMDIKMLDIDKTYDMETLNSGGMDKFVQYYGQITFKCTKIDYHSSTGKVKYMLIEQITQ